MNQTPSGPPSFKKNHVSTTRPTSFLKNIDNRMADGEGKSRLLTIIAYALGIAGMVGIGFGARYLIKRWYEKNRKKMAEQQSFKPGNPADVASKIYLAFDNNNWFGWGVDYKYLKFIVEKEIPSKKFYEEVQERYRDLFGAYLNDDLRKNVTDTARYQELSDIFNKKPEK